MNLKQRVLSTMKSREVESDFELYVTRTPGYLWALFFRWLHIHPIAVTLMSIVIGSASAYFFLFDDICYNLIGMLLLIWANWYDCADGQLARMTGKKTLVGRVLDGFAGNVWAFFIYIALLLRMWPEWGITIFILESWAGFYCHSRQCALADYYRNIHMYFLLGAGKAELDSSAMLKKEMNSMKWCSKDWFHKLYLYFYARYTGSQENQVKVFHKMMTRLNEKYGQDFPATLREDFCRGSKPLMPVANIITSDIRVAALFLCIGFGIPWMYFIFESTVLEVIHFYLINRHEKLCQRIIEKYT
jgi:phosphatidylglycerophosphate synthase